MNTSHFGNIITAYWCRRGTAILGAVLAVGAVVFGLTNQTGHTVAPSPLVRPAALPAAIGSAYQRFVDHKQEQAAGLDIDTSD